MTSIRKSQHFRSVYANGAWIAASEAEFRLLFINQEPIEVDSAEEGAKAIQEAPHYQVEVIMTRQLAKWVRDVLDTYLKQTEVKT